MRIGALEKTVQSQATELVDLKGRIEELESQLTEEEEEGEEGEEEEQYSSEGETLPFKLFISNIPFSCTESQLSEELNVSQDSLLH